MKIYTKNDIEELASILKNDGVISVPTDTVYGLCARINSIKAYENLIKAKNRPKDKLFPIMCADKEQIKSIAIVNEKIEKIIDKFMPGPITLILMKKQNLPEYVTNGVSTIAVRMASSKTIETLIRKIQSPIFMTSANQSGETVCTSLNEIEKKCPTLDGMLEGDVSFSKASTILDCVASPVKIVRQGPITIEQIINTIKQ